MMKMLLLSRESLLFLLNALNDRQTDSTLPHRHHLHACPKNFQHVRRSFSTSHPTTRVFSGCQISCQFRAFQSISKASSFREWRAESVINSRLAHPYGLAQWSVLEIRALNEKIVSLGDDWRKQQRGSKGVAFQGGTTSLWVVVVWPCKRLTRAHIAGHKVDR